MTALLILIALYFLGVVVIALLVAAIAGIIAHIVISVCDLARKISRYLKLKRDGIN